METGASLYYVLNMMTKFGETHHLSGRDFVETVEQWVGRTVEGVIYNTTPPREEILNRYAPQKSEFVTVDHSENWAGTRNLCGCDLLDTGGDLARHDSKKLASLIQRTVEIEER